MAIRFSHGDTVFVQGTLKAEIQEKNGELALSFGVIAERIFNATAEPEVQSCAQR
jgi:hypothetical protein